MDVEREHGQTDDVADAGLVLQARGGDRKAFDRLVERYDRRAFAVAYRLLGNRHDALEACQDAFLRGYRSLDTLAEPARFGAWLLRIVGNLALNFRRARGLRTMLPLDDEQAGPADEARTGPTRADEPLLAAELEQAIHQAVAELPENQRMALTLFSMNGMSQKEVAEILDCSIEAVKWYVFQARKTLKQKLGEYL